MSSTEGQSRMDNSAPQKQAACLGCRRSKVKCIRDAESTICHKCQATSSDCVVPEYHIGRYKGVKNKRIGLEKAIYQVEQALKRSKRNSVSFDPDTDVDLRQLITAPHLLRKGERSCKAAADGTRSTSDRCVLGKQSIEQSPISERRESRPALGDDTSLHQPEKADELALENAENPLQLLAMASALPNQSATSVILPSPGVTASQIGSHAIETECAELQRFFGSLMPNLDNSQDFDPIELGLVTEDEAESFFKYFYENLSHTRWGLDPVLHTSSFVRSRSTFLFTSILAAAATFTFSAAAHAKRLSAHRDHLAQRVVFGRHRSVEVVLAFLVNIPWMSPTKHWADDETCAFLSMALTIALDLQLNKIVVPSPTIRPPGFLDRVAKSDCISMTKALQLDGFPNADPTSAWGRRLLRSRERVWLALFVLDRGICLARGRPYAVPMGPLVESCDAWHISDIADRWDGSIISTAVLRRDLIELISSIREACDSSQLNVTGDSSAVKFLKDKMDRFFERWYAVWPLQVTQGNGQLPPYVEILVSHTKLSTYCSVINHPTASSDVKKFFRAAGLTSAMNVMRAAVQGEVDLKSMPNNTAIMVSFAACFALGLSTYSFGGQAFLAPDARSLIEHTAQVLERIGTTPKHRNGASALFGRHIRRIMRASFPEQNYTTQLDSLQEPLSAPRILDTVPITALPDAAGDVTSRSVPYPFDMTDDQIIEAINNASASQELFQFDENLFLDWLEWPNTS